MTCKAALLKSFPLIRERTANASLISFLRQQPMVSPVVEKLMQECLSEVSVP